ncbi:MAG: permease-like cell division protein FtsX [Thiohalocapsa sp.]
MLQCWANNHVNAASETIDRLARTPLATAMTVAAIAIALALPATLFVVLDNLERLGGGLERGAGVSLFLQPGLDEVQASELATRLRARPDITAVELISREQGLAEFRDYSGLGAALDQLSQNPLPVVIALHPSRQAQGPESMGALATALERLPEVDFARLDIQWMQRFNAILTLTHNAARLLAVVLGLAVLLVVGNTIRLEIQNRCSEVQVMDLVGATPAFIRRPFLYSGAWHGLLGGIGAWAMVSLSTQLLQGPVGRLATLYHTEFALAGLDLRSTLVLLAVGVAMGTIGSWLAVAQHLSQTDPR